MVVLVVLRLSFFSLAAVIMMARATPSNLWLKTIGGAENEGNYDEVTKHQSVEQMSAVVTQNGDILVVGKSKSFLEEGAYSPYTAYWDGIIIRLTSNGTLRWIYKLNSIDTITGSAFHDVLETDDGDIVVCGYAEVGAGTTGIFDALVVRLRESGAVLWVKKWHSNYRNHNYFRAVEEVGGGDLVVCGHVRDVGSSDWRAILTRWTIGGDLVWARELEVGGLAYRVAAANGYIYVAGQSFVLDQAPLNDAVISKWTLAGALVEFRRISYPGGGNDLFTDVIALSDGDIICVGYTAGPHDALIARFGQNLTLKYTQTFGAESGDMAHAVNEVDSGDIVIVGLLGETYGLISRWSGHGDVIWTAEFGGSGTDRIFDISVLSAGHAFIVGYGESLGAGKRDIFAAKIDAVNGVFPDCSYFRLISVDQQSVSFNIDSSLPPYVALEGAVTEVVTSTHSVISVSVVDEHCRYDSPTATPTHSFSTSPTLAPLSATQTASPRMDASSSVPNSSSAALMAVIFAVLSAVLMAIILFNWRRQKKAKAQIHRSRRSRQPSRGNLALDALSPRSGGSPSLSPRARSENHSRRSLASTSPVISSSSGTATSTSATSIDWYAGQYLQAPPPRASPSLPTEAALRRQRRSAWNVNEYTSVDVSAVPFTLAPTAAMGASSSPQLAAQQQPSELYATIELKDYGASDNTLPSKANVPNYGQLQLKSGSSSSSVPPNIALIDKEGYGQSPGLTGVYKTVKREAD